MTIIIIDYGSGNLRSVAKALERVAEGKAVKITGNAKDLRAASHIVLPGVGAFADCMSGLKALPGMLDSLGEEVQARQKPFLGICVGMQMLFDEGYEHGVHPGLGWLKGKVMPLQTQLKIPHMGWNELHIEQNHPLLSGIENGAHAYFVHSYHAQGANGSEVLATTAYGQKITAVVAKGNIMGTQFHPEKSQGTGLKLLKNFLEIG